MITLQIAKFEFTDHQNLNLKLDIKLNRNQNLILNKNFNQKLNFNTANTTIRSLVVIKTWT